MQRWMLILGIVCGANAGINLQGNGIVEGVVALQRASAVPAITARYQIKASGPVAAPEPAKAVVYLEGTFAGATNKVETMRLGQKGFQFEQGLLPVQKGTVVEFPNLDDDYHNVFSYSKVKRFDLGRYKKDEKPASQKFDRPGVVKLYCEIHEHMRSTILVLDTPYFQKTDATGKFRLNDIPPGHYKLKAWLDEDKVLEQEIDVKEGQPTLANFDSK
jgi:plastocyanin